MHEVWTDKHWTEADLAELPQDEGLRYEIIDGRLYVSPPNGESHQSISGDLLMSLLSAAPRGWRVLYSIGIRIGEQLLIPDGIVLPPGTPTADEDYNDVTVIRPALVIEVASRSTDTIDAGNKQVVYAAGDILAYWRVTLDGTIHMHQLVAHGTYGLVATVAPGTQHEALWPFRVSVTAKPRA